MYVVRPLFARFQKELVSFSNTKAGRDFISQFGGKEIKENYQVVKVTPDSVHQQIDKNTYRAVFYSRSPYVKLFGEVLTMMDIASENNYRSKRSDLVIPHYLGETNLLSNELPRIYLESGTFNPDANPESTSIDGWVSRGSVNEAWSTIRAGAGTHVATAEETTLDIFFREGTGSLWSDIRRAIVLFDTSSLSDSSIISAAILSFYQTTTFENTFGGAVCVVNTTPASNTSLATTDYGNVGTTQQASDISMSAISQSAYNDWTLNATGISNISLTGITKFGSSFSFDRANSSPTATGSVSPRNQLDFNSADNASNKPKLVVTYTVPIGDGYSFFM